MLYSRIKKIASLLLGGILMVSVLVSPLVDISASALLNIHYDETVGDNDWKTKSGDIAPIEDGVITMGEYLYVDQEMVLGQGEDGGSDATPISDGSVTFDIKIVLNEDPPNDWAITFNMMDRNIGVYFWDGGAKPTQITFKYLPLSKKMDVLPVYEGEARGHISFDNIEIADGEWHTLKLAAGKNGWGDGRKMPVNISVDGEVTDSKTFWHDGNGYKDDGSYGYNTEFAQGKFSILKDSSCDAYIRKVGGNVLSNIHYDETIGDNDWKTKSGDIAPIEDGVITMGEYLYVDRKMMLGEGEDGGDDKAPISDGSVTFDIKIVLNEDPPNDWAITFNMMDRNIGVYFWDGGAKPTQITFKYLPLSKKMDVLPIYEGEARGHISFNNIAIADGEWHTLKLAAGKNGWGDGRKMPVNISVDGEVTDSQTFWHDNDGYEGDGSYGYNTEFAQGKFSILKDSSCDAYIRKVENVPEVISNGPLNIPEAIEKGYVYDYSGKGGLSMISDGVVNAYTKSIYFDQDVILPEQTTFMIKLENLGDDIPTGWQLTISLPDLNVGTHFWQDDAKSINLQLTPFDDAVGGMLDYVYKNGANKVFGVCDSSFECPVALFDGQWHRMSIGFQILEDGRGRMVCKIDGQDFVDHVMSVGDDIDLNDYFGGDIIGQLTFYNGEKYNLYIKASEETDGDIFSIEEDGDSSGSADGDDDEEDETGTGDDTQDKDKDTSPKTGDGYAVTQIPILLTMAAVAIMSVRRKKSSCRQ